MRRRTYPARAPASAYASSSITPPACPPPETRLSLDRTAAVAAASTSPTRAMSTGRSVSQTCAAPGAERPRWWRLLNVRVGDAPCGVS